jgi:hypothetical protein
LDMTPDEPNRVDQRRKAKELSFESLIRATNCI